jgi:hypothetical protein
MELAAALAELYTWPHKALLELMRQQLELEGLALPLAIPAVITEVTLNSVP